MQQTAAAVGLELALIESEFRQTRKLFLADDNQISPSEQQSLDRIQETINQIKQELTNRGVDLDSPVSKELKGLFARLYELLQLYKKAAQTRQV